MFERFTDAAREVVRRAQEEARAMRHDYIGTEHLLIALAWGEDPAAAALHESGLTADEARRRTLAALAATRSGGKGAVHDGGVGLDPTALATLGIDLDQVREAVEAEFGPGALDSGRAGRVRRGHIPLTDRGKKVLELSLRAAVRGQSPEIGTRHLLLGIIDEGKGLGYRILAESGIDLAALRARAEQPGAPDGG